MLIAFGGMDSRLGIAPFEFLSMSAELDVKRIFVRDLSACWYHRGVAGQGPDVISLAGALKNEVGKHGVRHLVTTGNSAGGYAALLFGALIGAHEVLAFTPQTVLDLRTLHSAGDRRWEERLTAMEQNGSLDDRWADLGKVLPAISVAHTRYGVFFDSSFALDRFHAERLKSLEHVRFYRFGFGAHALVRNLRDCGALERLLRGALTVKDRSRPGAL
jgi:hypothetical protein